MKARVTVTLKSGVLDPQLVGWAKRSVPTILDGFDGEMVGTAQERLCPPYVY